jgi:hypothetical protein
VRTLEKLGFARTGADTSAPGRGERWHWEMTRTAWRSPLA